MHAQRETPAPVDAQTPATIVRLVSVRKAYRDVVAVDQVDVEIARGEFFTMLGPSGSGKTTTLRLIAGFEKPDRGTIELDGQDVTGLPPFERNVNTVFQDYALFPHMTVAGNIAYGLESHGVPRPEIAVRVQEALRMVRLESYGERRPTQLSGGQRQRVGLARAIVNRPAVLLLDEPLGALDLKLREEMQGELKRIQAEVGITFIYVTHDQDEALAMSDRLAVFSEGHLEQVGAPAEVYERPASAFVAGFVGTSNVITDDLARRLRGSSEAFTVRPEKLRCVPAAAAHDPADGEIRATGRIRTAVYLGERTRFTIDLDGGGELVAVEQNRSDGESQPLATPGTSVRVAWDRRFDQVLPGAPALDPAPTDTAPIDAAPIDEGSTNAAPSEGEACPDPAGS